MTPSLNACLSFNLSPNPKYLLPVSVVILFPVLVRVSVPIPVLTVGPSLGVSLGFSLRVVLLGGKREI